MVSRALSLLEDGRELVSQLERSGAAMVRRRRAAEARRGMGKGSVRLDREVRQEGVDAGCGEEGIVDGDVEFHKGNAWAEVLADGVEEGGVCGGVVEGLAFGADDADAAEGEEDGDGSGVGVDFFREDPAEGGAFI